MPRKRIRQALLFARYVATEINPSNIWGSTNLGRTKVCPKPSSQQRRLCGTTQPGAKHGGFGRGRWHSRPLPVPPTEVLSRLRRRRVTGQLRGRHLHLTTTPTGTTFPVLRPICMNALEKPVCFCSPYLFLTQLENREQ